MWEEGGTDALRRRPATGRPPKLDDDQVEQVRSALEQGAQAHGFEADLWTSGTVSTRRWTSASSWASRCSSRRSSRGGTRGGGMASCPPARLMAWRRPRPKGNGRGLHEFWSAVCGHSAVPSRHRHATAPPQRSDSQHRSDHASFGNAGIPALIPPVRRVSGTPTTTG
ncbi:hypothetical protein [Streptomyces flavidovirens]